MPHQRSCDQAHRRTAAVALATDPTAPQPRSIGQCAMAAPSHVSIIDLVAQKLGEDRDWLFDLACDQMEPGDGMIWTYDTSHEEPSP